MHEYFDPEHRQAVMRLRSSWTARTEWPTWLVIVAVYGGWFGTLWLLHARKIDLVTAAPLLVVFTTWYSSVQHELMHGHPTRIKWLNRLLGCAPIAVWYPYTIYRDTHLAHHDDERLTVPAVDPESNYVLRHAWQRMSPLKRALLRIRKTFVGRMVIGPPMTVGSLVKHTLRAWWHADFRYLGIWIAHGGLLAAMLIAMHRWSGVPVWYYLVVIAWPAQSIAMIRSFYEHRAVSTTKARIAINEAGPLMRLLFLNNNYHLVHHDLPALPWYLLPQVYRMRASEYIGKCDGFHIRGGYGELLRRYAFRSIDTPVHPFAGEV
ncbi:fatty acid desaturase [Pararobbsia silviterrae]|uniref:Aminotransferase n=1 Tax=Pararobbsia silviterrae TaxID=1792498 RepID=A0A494XDB1_9BURK|nr:fatty acid desaturase [Pararobbsia silviterrae]RKP46139.1 aminotransferase [Pararobbsia silviterrae]